MKPSQKRDRIKFTSIKYHKSSNNWIPQPHNISGKQLKVISFSLLLMLVISACTSSQQTVKKDNGFTYYSRAMEQYQAKNYTDALDYIDEAIKTNDRIAVYFELRGDIFNGMDSLGRALTEYDNAKSRRSFYPEIFIKTGDIYYRRNNYDAAIRDYRKAIAQRPEEPEIYLSLVHCYIQQREYDVAENLLGEYSTQAGKQKKPLLAEYNVLHAKIDFENNRYKQVAESMEAAQKLRELNRNESIFYLRSLIELGRLDDAYALALKLKDTVHESDTHFIRGLYYFKQENFKDAKTQLELSVQKKTKIFEAYQLLAEISKQRGDPDKGDEYLKSAAMFKSYRLINLDHKY